MKLSNVIYIFFLICLIRNYNYCEPAAEEEFDLPSKEEIEGEKKNGKEEEDPAPLANLSQTQQKKNDYISTSTPNSTTEEEFDLPSKEEIEGENGKEEDPAPLANLSQTQQKKNDYISTSTPNSTPTKDKNTFTKYNKTKNVGKNKHKQRRNRRKQNLKKQRIQQNLKHQRIDLKRERQNLEQQRIDLKRERQNLEQKKIEQQRIDLKRERQNLEQKKIEQKKLDLKRERQNLEQKKIEQKKIKENVNGAADVAKPLLELIVYYFMYKLFYSYGNIILNNIEGEDYVIYIDDKKVDNTKDNTYEVPVGQHIVKIMKLGYEDIIQKVDVKASENFRIVCKFKKVKDFKISNLKVSKEKMNPKEKKDPIKISFDVNQVILDKKVILEIKNDNGKTVFTKNFTSSTERTQSCVFEGKDNSGKMLPDGKYTIYVTFGMFVKQCLSKIIYIDFKYSTPHWYPGFLFFENEKYKQNYNENYIYKNHLGSFWIAYSFFDCCFDSPLATIGGSLVRALLLFGRTDIIFSRNWFSLSLVLPSGFWIKIFPIIIGFSLRTFYITYDNTFLCSIKLGLFKEISICKVENKKENDNCKIKGIFPYIIFDIKYRLPYFVVNSYLRLFSKKFYFELLLKNGDIIFFSYEQQISGKPNLPLLLTIGYICLFKKIPLGLKFYFIVVKENDKVKAGSNEGKIGEDNDTVQVKKNAEKKKCEKLFSIDFLFCW